MSVQTYFYHKKNYIAPGVHEDLYLVKKTIERRVEEEGKTFAFESANPHQQIFMELGYFKGYIK